MAPLANHLDQPLVYIESYVQEIVFHTTDRLPVQSDADKLHVLYSNQL